jgi:CRISPR-associated protein Cmr3
MSLQWVFIRAHDAWMFRDSKPFSAGQNFYARSVFPPHPSTMQGIVRSHYLLTTPGVDLDQFAKGELSDMIGTPASMGKLQVAGPFLARMTDRGIERFVRTPFDVLKEKKSGAVRILAPACQPSFITGGLDTVPDWHPPIIPDLKDDEQYEDAGDWLDETGLSTYLTGQFNGEGHIEASHLYASEDRVGLAIDYSRRTNKETLFYRAQFIRPRDDNKQDVGLLVGVNQPLFTERQGMMRVGGESRSGIYEIVDNYMPPEYSKTNGRIKIVLLTPAYFEAGCQPTNGAWGSLLGGSPRLVSMVLGKPLVISGWDMVRRGPKPLRHFVPAGSVYYFENASVPDNPFTESPINEPDYARMGFGAFAAGTWDYV